MDDLLTTRELEDLLRVDRITIYRMLDDGRLKGFKVGGQWRFSRGEVQEWLRGRRQDHQAEYAAEPNAAPSGAEPLPLSCIEAIQSVFAEARDVASVTTDMDGNPLTGMSNSCAFCDLVLSTEEGRVRCADSWRRAGSAPRPCHAGLLCAASRVRVGTQAVAKAVACQFAVPDPDGGATDWTDGVGRLALELGLDAETLGQAAGDVHALSEADLPKMERLLGSVAATYAEIGQERLKLLGRLRRIAEITALTD